MDSSIRIVAYCFYVRFLLLPVRHLFLLAMHLFLSLESGATEDRTAVVGAFEVPVKVHVDPRLFQKNGSTQEQG